MCQTVLIFPNTYIYIYIYTYIYINLSLSLSLYIYIYIYIYISNTSLDRINNKKIWFLSHKEFLEKCFRYKLKTNGLKINLEATMGIQMRSLLTSGIKSRMISVVIYSTFWRTLIGLVWHQFL